MQPLNSDADANYRGVINRLARLNPKARHLRGRPEEIADRDTEPASRLDQEIRIEAAGVIS